VYTCQKRPTKETCTCVKGDLQKRRVYLSKENYKRDVYTCQKRPTKETCTCVKRDPHKSSVYLSKETFKRDVCLVSKETYKRATPWSPAMRISSGKKKTKETYETCNNTRCNKYEKRHVREPTVAPRNAYTF